MATYYEYKNIISQKCFPVTAYKLQKHSAKLHFGKLFGRLSRKQNVFAYPIKLPRKKRTQLQRHVLFFTVTKFPLISFL